MGQYRYEATGSVAHERISPLLSSDDWIDISASSNDQQPDFLWENAPRRDTKAYRDTVKVYSHLPNGTAILDCKWALGRLFAEPREGDADLLATLETHCFRGPGGFDAFGKNVNLFESQTEGSSKAQKLPDILPNARDIFAQEPNNLWVIKDAQANGAGGIWVVGPENSIEFGKSGQMYPNHRYVAQKYVWPPVLFGGRKSHVRVYGLMTADGRAFVHSRAFLHVANDPFTTTGGEGFEDSIHITNCCANSHDDSKFAGEILASFLIDEMTERDGQTVIPLKRFFPSIQASIAGFAKRAFPYLQGGKANNGFEYLGVDFILSEDEHKNPLAYMLEINAPPSQDTATGLSHAENLHDEVIRDLIHLWVMPKVIIGTPEVLGGWNCVHQEEDEERSSAVKTEELIVPSKAAIINKIRWAIFERKAQKKLKKEKWFGQEEETKKGTRLKTDKADLCRSIGDFARSQFPFFQHCSNSYNTQQIFFENAGGSQVCAPVIQAMNASLIYRHRSVIGSSTKRAARTTFQRLLGATKSDPIILGPNASSLLAVLAKMYFNLGLLTASDEIIISTENHLANVQPWERVANLVGAKVHFWSPFEKGSIEKLKDLICHKTRILALPHASNILGQVRDISAYSRLVKERSEGRAHIVVDGVAASPHWFANVEQLKEVDWYVVSGHKLFGPHLGALYGRWTGAVELFLAGSASSPGNNDAKSVLELLERGTANYEGCAGIVGLGVYFEQLSAVPSCSSTEEKESSTGQACSESSTCDGTMKPVLDITSAPNLSIAQVREAYAHIRIAEELLVEALVAGLKQFSKVRILEDDQQNCLARLPIVSFVHETIPANTAYDFLSKSGISCRVSSFLCTEHFAIQFGFDRSDGILRASLGHYNTLQEVEIFLKTLNSIPGWNTSKVLS